MCSVSFCGWILIAVPVYEFETASPASIENRTSFLSTAGIFQTVTTGPFISGLFFSFISWLHATSSVYQFYQLADILQLPLSCCLLEFRIYHPSTPLSHLLLQLLFYYRRI